MHRLHSATSFWLLGFLGAGLTVALPATLGSCNRATITFWDLIMPEFSRETPHEGLDDHYELVARGDRVEYSPDKSCGNLLNGKDKGYTCGPMSMQDGCCSSYVSLLSIFFVVLVRCWLLTRIYRRVSAVGRFSAAGSLVCSPVSGHGPLYCGKGCQPDFG
jgi:hypothetical protein